MSIAERIKEKRKRNGFNQDELAEHLGVSVMTVRRWEWGKQFPRVDEVEHIAEVLNTTVTYLMGLDDNPSPSVAAPQAPSAPDEKSAPYTEQSSKNQGMLVYISPDGERFEAPPTEEGAKYIIQMRAASKMGAMKAKEELGNE